MSYHYGYPPTHYGTYSPHTSDEHVHYVPAYEDRTPTKGHGRRPSHQPSPRAGGWFSPADSPPHAKHDRYYAHASSGKSTYVTYKTRRPMSSHTTPSKPTTRPIPRPSQSAQVYEEEDFHAGPRIINREPDTAYRPRRAHRPTTDSYFSYDEEHIHRSTSEPQRRSRSGTATQSTTPSSKSSQSAHTPRKATPQDAAAYGIPQGYSIKHWDPDEEPIILLGSVFDAYSLGKWIYDWTVYKCGASTPIAEMAADLWLLLIKLAGKMKRAEKYLATGRIKRTEHREMVADFVDSGARIMQTFRRLLKDCEHYMWRAAKHEGSRAMMGRNAGVEFVDSVFGRDRYLQSTEKFMNNIRTWTLRFDANCEDILKRSVTRHD